MTNSSARRLVYLHSHPGYHGHRPAARPKEAQALAITIAAQTGSGALPVAQGLCAHLQQNTPAIDRPWQVLASGLIERVLEDHHLPTRMARFLPEDASSAVDDTLDELFGLHPSSWMIAHKSEETILKLARSGQVILVGWGANVITRELPNVFHVRLVGSLEKRIQRIQQREQLSRKPALDLITRRDRGRERYLKRYFGQRLSEPLLYHLTINTDRFSDSEIVRFIAAMAQTRITPAELASPAEVGPEAFERPA